MRRCLRPGTAGHTTVVSRPLTNPDRAQIVVNNAKSLDPAAAVGVRCRNALRHVLDAAGLPSRPRSICNRRWTSRSGKLLLLNLVYWYVPALLTPTHLPTCGALPPRRRALAAGPHTARAVRAARFSVVHCAWHARHSQLCSWITAASVPDCRPGRCSCSASTSQNLDWTLMVYSAIVGLSYALDYYRESQARAVKEAQLETSLARRGCGRSRRSCIRISSSTRCTRSRRWCTRIPTPPIA